MTAGLRAWVRYLVPFTLLAIIACAPLLYVALTSRAPTDVAKARMQVRLTWALAGCAIMFQVLLVAAVAPAVRAVAAAAPISQLRALVDGARGLVRGVLPWLVAMIAVVLGGVALVAPGAVLLVLVSLTGASDQLRQAPQVAIADSIAVVRPQLANIALIVVAIVAVNLAIAFAAQTMLVPAIPKKASAAKLLPVHTFLRMTTLAIVAWSSLAACALAGAYSHAKRR